MDGETKAVVSDLSGNATGSVISVHTEPHYSARIMNQILPTTYLLHEPTGTLETGV